MDQVDYIAEINAGRMGLINVPKKIKNHKICHAAVIVNGLDLYHVPKYMRSKTIYYAAAFQNTKAIELMDEEELMEWLPLVKLAIARNGSVFEWLTKKMPHLINFDLCVAAVKASGSLIRFVPAEFIKKGLISIAAQNDASALSHLYISGIPDISEAINDVIYSISLKHLPDHFKNYDVCLHQVKRQGRELAHVPFVLINEELVRVALNSNPWAIEFVPITFSELDCVVEIIEKESLNVDMQIVPKELFSHLASFGNLEYA